MYDIDISYLKESVSHLMNSSHLGRDEKQILIVSYTLPYHVAFTKDCSEKRDKVNIQKFWCEKVIDKSTSIFVKILYI